MSLALLDSSRYQHPADQQRWLMVVSRTCNAIIEGGAVCRAAPLRDGDFCLWHSPEHAEEVAESRRLGGLRRRREVAISGAYDFEGLGSVTQVRRLIEVAVLDTLAPENSVARSRTLAYMAQVALRALEVGELAERLAMLERRSTPECPRVERDSEPGQAAAVLEQAALEAWLRAEAARLDLPMEEAWRQNRLWEALLLTYGIREGDLLPLETIEAFLREFAVAAAPEDDPSVYVAETLADWEQQWRHNWVQAHGSLES